MGEVLEGLDREQAEREAEALLVAMAVLGDRQRSLNTQEERDALVRDFPRFVTHVCAHHISDQGDGEPWFDFSTPETPHSYMKRFFRGEMPGQSASRDPKGKLLLAPRGSGKTYIAGDLCFQDFLRDHSFRLQIAGEAGANAEDIADFLRGRFELNEEHYGPFRTLQWARDKLTIVRPEGRGAQPSLSICAPGKASTGKHPFRRWLDDVVGELAGFSPARQKTDLQWYKKLAAQDLANTEEWFTGTMWPGYHIYRYIIEEVEGKKNAQGIPYVAPGIRYYQGRDYEIMLIEAELENGDPVFPFHTREFLQRQRRKLGLLYDGQFMQRIIRDSEMGFVAELLHYERPPKKMLTLRYLLTDFAASENQGSKSSATAAMIIDVAANGKAYLRDGVHGKWRPDIVADKVADLVAKWLPVGRVYEETGAGKQYAPWIDERLRGRGVATPPWTIVPRPVSKDARLQAQLRPLLEQHRIAVDPDTFPRALYSEDPSGRRTGAIPEDLENYAFSRAGSYDLLDLLADIDSKDKYGQPVCRPPGGDFEDEDEEPPANFFEMIKREIEGRSGAANVVD